ncbi:MAG: hypothetical protein NVSMB65_09290 [Chloroflexota bacterium]
MPAYLVRCARCDQAFWLPEHDAAVPEHAGWDRKMAAQARARERCEGSAQPGYWVGEGEGPVRDWPR